MRVSTRLALAAVFAAVAVPAAAVQPITITSVGIYSPGRVDYTNGGTTKSEYSVPLTLTATYGAGRAAFDALGFCIDITHNIFVGLGSQLAVNLGYHVAPLTGDGAGRALSTSQVRQITGLATLGFGIARGGDSDRAVKLAAIQQAIWTVEYPASTFAATGDFAPAQAEYAARYVALAPTLRGHARTIVADNGSTQAFITNAPGVPEPATWVQLVAGFGVVGLVTRRRRTMTVVAA